MPTQPQCAEHFPSCGSPSNTDWQGRFQQAPTFAFLGSHQDSVRFVPVLHLPKDEERPICATVKDCTFVQQCCDYHPPYSPSSPSNEACCHSQHCTYPLSILRPNVKLMTSKAGFIQSSTCPTFSNRNKYTRQEEKEVKNSGGKNKEVKEVILRVRLQVAWNVWP